MVPVFFRYLHISYTLYCLDPFPNNTFKEILSTPNLLILALTETSPFQMQNTQKEYASLFLTVHICHTFPIHAYLFYKDYDLMLYVKFLVLK